MNINPIRQDGYDEIRPPRNARRPLLAPLAYLLLLLLGIALLSGCGHKHTQAQVPPPPLPQEKPAAPPSAETTGGNEKIEVSSRRETDLCRDRNGELVRRSLSQPARIERRGLQHARHDGGASYLAAGLDRAHHEFEDWNFGAGADHRPRAVRAWAHRRSFTGRREGAGCVPARHSEGARLEVLQAPAPLATGGRWAVQIGSFTGEKAAAELAEHMQRRYQTAQVLKFVSPVGVWWVRVRVPGDDRQRAAALAHETETAEGSVFLVRLD